MKRLCLFFFIVFVFSFESLAQTGDGGAGWANNIILRMEQAARKVKDKKDLVFQNKLLAHTVNTVRLLDQSKQIIGTVSATMKDMRSLTDLFQQDVKRISALSQQEMDGLLELFDFRDAIAGNGYQSLFNVSDWYMAETSMFRDRQGFLNPASAIINAGSPERSIQLYGQYRSNMLRMQRNLNRSDDYKIISLLNEARRLDRVARLRTMQLNLALFGSTFVDFKNTAGSFRGERISNRNNEEIRDNAGGDSKNSKPLYSQETVNELFDQVQKLLEDADAKRAEAMQLYWLNVWANEPAVERALRNALRGSFERREAALIEAYKMKQRGSVVRLEFERPKLGGLNERDWRN